MLGETCLLIHGQILHAKPNSIVLSFVYQCCMLFSFHANRQAVAVQVQLPISPRISLSMCRDSSETVALYKSCTYWLTYILRHSERIDGIGWMWPTQRNDEQTDSGNGQYMTDFFDEVDTCWPWDNSCNMSLCLSLYVIVWLSLTLRDCVCCQVSESGSWWAGDSEQRQHHNWHVCYCSGTIQHSTS